MAELLDYLKTLKERGPGLAYRELKSRFIRGPVKAAVRRIMDACERHDAVFTFFITGNCAMVNKPFMREILDRGHEIACHGYNHLRFDKTGRDLGLKDLDLAKRIFRELFGCELKGFRAPYLGMDQGVAALLAESGFAYSSSVMATDERPGPFAWDNGLPEYPIAACDWHSLIRDRTTPEDFLAELRAKDSPGATFELHPWRMGQKKYAWVVEEFLRHAGQPGLSMSALAANPGTGMALTGDLGELGFAEVGARALFKRMTDYGKVAALLDRKANAG